MPKEVAWQQHQGWNTKAATEVPLASRAAVARRAWASAALEAVRVLNATAGVKVAVYAAVITFLP